jgi:hypothetical protein
MVEMSDLPLVALMVDLMVVSKAEKMVFLTVSLKVVEKVV